MLHHNIGETNLLYKNIKNGKTYKLISNATDVSDNKSVNVIVYQHNNIIFVRKEKEFFNKFEKI